LKARFLVPFGIFVALVVFFAIGLNHDPREIPSPLIDKPAPAFSLPQLSETSVPFAPESMRGKVWLLNVWATWCVACREEHSVLVELARSGQLPIIGLNYKEVRGDTSINNAEQLKPAEALALGRDRIRAWFAQHGNPYTFTALDLNGRVGIDYGVYGVPESYVIDKQGVIRLKHIGPLTPQVLQTKILPLVRELSK
jgi:cytochrome c biogenesis protein CcmG/thiol:disulfide interchange protein DsbE